MRIVWLLLWLCGCSPLAAAQPSVEVRGLFGGGAVLEIDGALRTLRQGQISPEGVLLRSADTRQAVLEVEGQVYTVGLSKRIAAHFVAPPVQRAVIYLDPANQYRIEGAINGQGMELLVDTGASDVAMSAVTASALGIDFRKPSQRIMARTASGLAPSYRVSLDAVRIGDITLRQVDAMVVEGKYPEVVLLGMSFLRHVDMRDNGGVLHLEHQN